MLNPLQQPVAGLSPTSGADRVSDADSWAHARHASDAVAAQRHARWIEQLTEGVRELVDAHELDTETRDAAARADLATLGLPKLPPELAGIDPVILRFMRRVPMPPDGLAGIEEQAPGLLERLAPHGLLPPTRRLPDGSTGWYIRDGRKDDCWASALSTCLQVPIDEVPDPHIDERLDAGEPPEEINRSALQEFDLWLTARGLRMVAHRKPPVTKRRWLGIVALDGWFQDHALVMCRDAVLFDPISALAYARPVRSFGRADVQLGLDFQALNRQERQ